MTNHIISPNIRIMIPRLIQKPITSVYNAFSGKVILILGARQTGKTTLIKILEKNFQNQGKKTLYLNCDLDEDLTLINTTSLTRISKITTGTDYLFIDEAQRMDNPGLTLKILVDNFPNLKITASGSSAFELKNSVSDALSGRYLDFPLFPLSISEVTSRMNQADYLYPDYLRFGSYPEVYLTVKTADKELLLQKIIDSFLFKDILSFQKVRNSQMIKNLTRALAYQIGSEVNENELANRLKIDRKTVVSYLDILEQSFVIFRIHPYSRNPRREIGRNSKIYFMDIGIRNALIGDFNTLEVRSDSGALWENFLISERMKKLSFNRNPADFYFWRTYNGAEVDLLEKPKNKPEFKAFEFKYSDSKISRGAKSFSSLYKTTVEVINRENYQDFIF